MLIDDPKLSSVDDALVLPCLNMELFILIKEMNFCPKLKSFNPFIFATRCCTPEYFKI